MGGEKKNQGVKKNLNNDEQKEKSCSTLSIRESSKREKERENQVEELATKRMKFEESSNPNFNCNGQGQVGAEKLLESKVEEVKGSISDLPPEMLMEILKCVNIWRLFQCRLVNRNWSEISTEILQKRPVAPIHFKFQYGKFPQIPVQSCSWSLKEFAECMKKSTSKNCSYSQFRLEIPDLFAKSFEHEDFQEFLSLFSTLRMQFLNLELYGYCKAIEEFHICVEKLRTLLLEKIPHLEQLELYLSHPETIDARHVKLFPIQNSKEKAEQRDGKIETEFQLPHLKTIYFGSKIISRYPAIATDLLNAAVNLTRICLDVKLPRDFQFLHSLGKLDLLKRAHIEMNKELVSAIKNQTQNQHQHQNSCTSLVKLQVLILECYTIDKICMPEAGNFLANLFESSKDTLTELYVTPFGFFRGLQLPTFKNLYKLTVNACNRDQIFPPGTRSESRHVFPAVSDFVLRVGNFHEIFSQQDSIPIFQSLKILVVKVDEIEAADISVLARMFPNAKKFKLQKHYFFMSHLNFLPVGRAIWTEMKTLESLEVEVNVGRAENSVTALDSLFTGFSIENCRHIHEIMEARKTAEESGIPGEFPESGAESKTVREYPSILDMKDLKQLTINLRYGGEKLEKQEFWNQVTKVSQEFAFKLMPQLKVNEEE